MTRHRFQTFGRRQFLRAMGALAGAFAQLWCGPTNFPRTPTRGPSPAIRSNRTGSSG